MAFACKCIHVQWFHYGTDHWHYIYSHYYNVNASSRNATHCQLHPPTLGIRIGVRCVSEDNIENSHFSKFQPFHRRDYVVFQAISHIQGVTNIAAFLLDAFTIIILS